MDGGPLHFVAGSHNPYALKVARVLLQKGFCPNESSATDGITPLHVAIEWDNSDMLELFLQYGGNPELRMSDGRTAFDLLSDKEKDDCCKILLDRWKRNKSLGEPSEMLITKTVREEEENRLSDDLSSLHSTDVDEPNRFAQFTAISGRPGEINGPKTPVKSRRCPSLFAICFQKQVSSPPYEREKKTGEEKLIGERQNDKKKKMKKKEAETEEELCRSVAGTALVDVSELEETVIVEDSVEVKEDTVEVGDTVDVEKTVEDAFMALAVGLDDAALRRELTARGLDVGPILPGTRRLYARQLALFLQQDRALNRHNCSQTKKWSRELEALLQCRMDIEAARSDETLMTGFFEQSLVSGRSWREGQLKTSFCYLLIDPLVLNPSSNTDVRTFIESVFYVGKGKRSRPHQHLTEAVAYANKPEHSVEWTVSDKTKRILEIWKSGNGIISLHVFQNTIPVEAFCREAAMIDAIGLQNLVNVKRGDYYGPMTSWSRERRCRLGAFLLKQALAILQIEGCRQLFSNDIL